MSRLGILIYWLLATDSSNGSSTAPPAERPVQSASQPIDEVFRIASENPIYLRALENIASMKENYEAERKKRFGN